MENFKKETQRKNEIRLQKIIDDMPEFVIKYFDFIHLSTSASSRLEYARDISAFMNSPATVEYE